MNLIVSLIIGGIIGWLASLVMKTNAQMGMIANVIVGIVGSALGFWLAGVLGIGTSPPWAAPPFSSAFLKRSAFSNRPRTTASGVALQVLLPELDHRPVEVQVA